MYYTVKMVKQGRTQKGKFVSKSDEPRLVRTMRLTDSAWEKLGKIANSRCITRADLLEEWAKHNFQQQPDQLSLFNEKPVPGASSKEAIDSNTRKTGTHLANRLGVSSAALTNWIKAGNLAEKTKELDPDGVAWERESGTTKYRPIQAL